MKSNIKYQGQVLQDKFVCNVLKHKNKGTFIEIGSHEPKYINNTYVLEKDLNWTGLMFEIQQDKYEQIYKNERPGSKHIFGDATTHDYDQLFKKYDIPYDIDYLQLDIEPPEQSWKALNALDKQVMSSYRFATITFEHDYLGREQYNWVRLGSREIFKSRGYHPVFHDIANGRPGSVYEDWYVHPELVDMDYVKQLQLNNQKKYIPGVGDADVVLRGRHIEYH